MIENLDRTTLAAKPWSKIPLERIKDLVAYTFPEERQVAVWVARDCHTGAGHIIDAGAFFGGSALCLALGLEANSTIPESEKLGRIHAFDSFRWERWIKPDFLPRDVEFGSSFLNVFHNNVMDLERYLVIHPGPIEKRAWTFGPIETLFIDCAKTFVANARIVEMLFPRLIPGRSIVNQQDYAVVGRLVWLYATMEYFRDKFEELASTSAGGTTLFRLVEEIAPSEASACVEALRTNCLHLAERASTRYAPEDRRHQALVGSLEAFRRSPLPLA